jgi:hypothetical protein
MINFLGSKGIQYNLGILNDLYMKLVMIENNKLLKNNDDKFELFDLLMFIAEEKKI